MKKLLTVLIVFLLLILVSAPSIFAQDVASSSPKPKRFGLETRQMKENVSDLRSASKGAIKSRVCEVHAKVINKRATMIVQRTTKMQERLGKVSDAIQKFYTEKLVPDGKTLSNYDSLISSISAKKAALIPLVDEVKNDAQEYSCEADDPRSEFEDYRKDMQALIIGIQEYRKSIKTLLVAVMNLKGGESPTPSLAP